MTAQTSNPRTLKMTMIAGCVQMGPGTLTRSESERARECVETSGEGDSFLAREREAATGDGERGSGCFYGRSFKARKRADNPGEAQKSSGIAKETRGESERTAASNAAEGESEGRWASSRH